MKKLTTSVAALALVAVFASPSFAGDCGTSKSAAGESASMRLASDVSEPQQNIVEVAVAAGNFTTLVAAVQAAGLVEALSGEGPFTVFAPTDEAFAKLPEGTLEALLADPDQLAQVLTYHVVPGIVLAADVVKVTKMETLQGQELMIKSKKEGVTVDKSSVIQADILATNGVIHVIDEVLLPKTKKNQ